MLTSIWGTTAVLLLLALLLLAAVVRLLEPRLAFFPIGGETGTPCEPGIDYRPETVETSDGQRLRAWVLHGAKSRARILYFHGNGGNLSIAAPVVTGIAVRGFAVFAFDYRGYGLSTGHPTEHGLYRDVEAVVERFWSGSPGGGPVVYWGRSLGVAMASYAATVHQPDGLILESGFPNVRSLLRTAPLLRALARFSTYRFPSNRFLQRLDASVPVLVLHGDNDHVVPIAQGRALFEGIGAEKRFVIIRGGAHNDVVPSDPGRYWDAVDRFISDLDRV